MIACPNCCVETTTRALPAFGAAKPIEVESCAACNLFWFDDAGSVRLKPEGVIDLFRYMGTAVAAGARRPLAANFTCPRCSRPLAYTHDVQRTTRFTYWRCLRDDGQLITFAQFLREKNFVRTPSPAELAKLRETVRQVVCSQCGAPVDLATDSACPHCGTPVALIDPDGVAKALQALAAARPEPATADPEAVRSVLADAQADAILARERMRGTADGTGHDLVSIGVAAIAGWLVGRLTGD